MNITVCLKQVPGTTKVEVDEKTGVLIRDGIDSKMNPYDLYAIETAIKLKESYGGEVTSITMGPPQAKEIIKEAYMMGVDKGGLLTDKAFAGADVLATSYALSQGITKMSNFDLIICGKQTTDGDTAQVGPEIAEFLAIPHVANVTKIIDISNDTITVEMDMGSSIELQEIQFPCLITVDKDIYVPRLPSYKKKIETQTREVAMLTLRDLNDPNPEMYGLFGSPTQVERIFPPDASTERTKVEGTGEETSLFIFNKLKELKYI